MTESSVTILTGSPLWHKNVPLDVSKIPSSSTRFSSMLQHPLGYKTSCMISGPFSGVSRHLTMPHDWKSVLLWLGSNIMSLKTQQEASPT